MNFAKTLKLRFRVGDLDLPEGRKRYTSSREEEEVDAQMCPCGTAIESRTYMVGECEVYKEEQDVLEEELRETDECDLEEFGALDSSEKTIATLKDRWWNRKRIRIATRKTRHTGKQRNERPTVGCVSIRSRNGAPFRKGFVVNGQMTKASSK